MEIFEPIIRSQALLKQISSERNTTDEDRLTSLLISLSEELNDIKLIAHQLTEEIQQLQNKQQNPSTTQDSTKPEIKLGCYIFTNEKGFFCPNCYDQAGNKVATTRINSKLRVCPTCKITIK